jgi:hypothetical protein
MRISWLLLVFSTFCITCFGQDYKWSAKIMPIYYRENSSYIESKSWVALGAVERYFTPRSGVQFEYGIYRRRYGGNQSGRLQLTTAHALALEFRQYLGTRRRTNAWFTGFHIEKLFVFDSDIYSQINTYKTEQIIFAIGPSFGKNIRLTRKLFFQLNLGGSYGRLAEFGAFGDSVRWFAYPRGYFMLCHEI